LHLKVVTDPAFIQETISTGAPIEADALGLPGARQHVGKEVDNCYARRHLV
jgi:hypothetical protein